MPVSRSRASRTGGGAAAHRSDHRFQLVHGANAAFDLTELAAHGAFFCSRPTARLLARSRTAEARAEWVASSSVLVIAATLAPAFASRCEATCWRTSAMTVTGRESKTLSASAASSATWSTKAQSGETRLSDQRPDTFAADDLCLDAGVRKAAEAGEHLKLEQLRIVEANTA
jgi:hypothetical protein